MMELNEWLMLLLATLVGIGGLYLASSAGQGTAYTIGLVVFVAAVGYAFYLIKRHFDRIEGHP